MTILDTERRLTTQIPVILCSNLYPALKSGTIYRGFSASNGRKVVLRAICWDDLHSVLELANNLVSERAIDPNFGILLDKKQTLDTEADWLSTKVAGIEKGEQISVIAEVDSKIVGNSEVVRGKSTDEYHHGVLGIAIHRDYRNLGIGLEMIRTLIEESRKSGLKTISLETFANNLRAIHVYESAGFRQVGRIPKKIYRNGEFTDAIVMSMEL